jgi:hypothetical protein
MKKDWLKPELEVLDVNMTMAGPGIRTSDDHQCDPDEDVHHS